ncbi:hypothetical protein D9758_008573 [Tetrapyrgos nigripes]|uniref:Uncharacterized protein n=1 Tax=Tetrapyrgos nigripes TaxID=182062 RepID=A0A8H5G5H3_9AGAR|nr:hypothetical protein D9758_008573 [Tetrapyrgos nigripes]
MPAPEVVSPSQDARPIVGHVNLMVDTYIANATTEDLRSSIRGLLSSGMPGVASAFTMAARQRLDQVDVDSIPGSRPLFEYGISNDGEPLPTDWLFETLARFKWDSQGEMAKALTVVDSDISQAIQSCKEEMDAGRASDVEEVRVIVQYLRSAVDQSMMDVESWGGEFPFERASFSIEYWKL